MGSGRTHAVDTQITAIVGGVAIAYGQHPAAGLAFGAGAALGLLINPDLDQQTLTYSEWKVVRHTFGLGFLWVAYWWPYSTWMAHRHVSHWPLIGTLTRLAYLAPLWYALWLVGLRPEPWMAWAVAGLCVADAVHWLRDGLPLRAR
jgi:uncharacterized metal-binding protein